TLKQCRSRVGSDSRLVATVPYLPHELALHFVAYANAAIAIDTLRHIDMDIRVRIIEQRRMARSAAFGFESVVSKIAMKLLIGETSNHITRVLARKKPEQRSPQIFKLGRMRVNHHPID